MRGSAHSLAVSDVSDRIQAKVNRAKQHVEEFQVALREFFDTKPYTYVVRDDPKVGRRGYYVERLDTVPLNVEAIAHDALTNLREAIDHVAVQIETAACCEPLKRKVYFPVGQDAGPCPLEWWELSDPS